MSKKNTLALAVSALLAGHCGVAFADLESVRNFDIPAQPLSSALIQFSKQADVQVVGRSHALTDLTTPGVSGRLSGSEALRRLIGSNPVNFEPVTNRSVRILSQQEDTAEQRSDHADSQTTVGAFKRTSLESQSGQRGVSNRASPLRIAQSGADGESGVARAENNEAKVVLEEIVVTGSHIKGVRAIGAPVIEITRADIEKTGYATAQEVLLTLPQNQGSLNERNSGTSNWASGVGADLRGLGPGATLTLVNGRRQPTAGDGRFVDLSSIPASAIERIEVLTDGASAIYGSDAIGGVVNIILRRDYEGAETQLRFAGAGSMSEAKETLLSHTYGHSWDNANVLVGYQYLDREPLAAADRALTRSADKRPFGGRDFREFYSNPGNITLLDGTRYAIPSGQDGRSLTRDDLLPASQANRGEPHSRTDVISGNRTHSAFLSASWRPIERLELFADGRYSRRDLELHQDYLPMSLPVPETHPFNPIDQLVFVDYDLIEDFDVKTSGEVKTWASAAGARIGVWRDWSITASANIGSERTRPVTHWFDYAGLFAALADPDPSTVFNPFGDGSHTNPQTLASLRALDIRTSEMSVRTYNAVAQGELFVWYAGSAKLALGAEYREEELDSPEAIFGRQNPGLERDVLAAFAEFVTPLWAHSGKTLLEGSFAGRYEKYSDFGSSFNPRVALQLHPTPALSVHASWSTSFRAPRLVEIDEVPEVNALLGFPDGEGGELMAVALGFDSQANAGLQEETADSWNFGIRLTPIELQGFELTLNYYGIDYDSRIVSPFYYVFLEPFSFPEWADIVNRNPSAELLAAACSGLLGGNGAAQCAAQQPTAIVDYRYRNVSTVRTRGLDLQWSQSLQTPLGALVLGMNGNYVLEYDQQVSPGAATASLVDTYGQPLRLRVRSSASLSRGAWNADLSINYAGAYRNPQSTVSPRIGSWTTVDAGIGYRMDEAGGFLRGTQLSIRAANLLDEMPPFADNSLGYDTVNGRVLGRFVSVTVTKAW